MFDDCSTICLTVMRSVPRGCASWITRSATWSVGGSTKAEFGVTIPSSSAAAIVTSLKVEPGSYVSVTARFLRPVGPRRREAVGVEPRRRGHREHGSRVRVHDDGRRGSRAPAAHRLLEHLLGVVLDLVVEREANVAPGRLLLRRDDVERAPERVLDDRLASGPSGEHRLERPLEPLEALVVEARVPDHLCTDGTLWVVAQLFRIEADPGVLLPREALGLDRVGLSLQEDEPARPIDELRIDGGRLEAQRLAGRECQVARLVDLARIGVHGRRRLADRERLAIAVDDGSPTGGNDDRLPMLAKRHGRVLGSLDDLDPDGAQEGRREEEEERRGEEDDAAVRRGRLQGPMRT